MPELEGLRLRDDEMVRLGVRLAVEVGVRGGVLVCEGVRESDGQP